MKRMSTFSSTAPTTPFKGGIVFLHGSGDTGEGLLSWINGTHETFLKSLAEKGFEVSFPSATPRRYSLFGGEIANVWHDRTDLAITCNEDTEGVLKSMLVVDREIEGFIARGVPAEHVFVFGLSMGGHLALQTMCHSKYRGQLAGVVGLSCFLSTTSPAWDILQGIIKESKGGSGVATPPVCMMHGQADAMVPCQWGEVTSNRLKDIGMSVQFGIIPRLGHDLAHSELQHVLDWISELCTAKQAE